MPGEINNWKQQVLARETLLDKDSNCPYADWLISKFFSIACGF